MISAPIRRVASESAAGVGHRLTADRDAAGVGARRILPDRVAPSRTGRDRSDRWAWSKGIPQWCGA